MKAIRLIILLNLFSFSLSAQITTRQLKTEEVVKPIIYDSSYFITTLVNEELKKYIGQEISIIPCSRKCNNPQYLDFYSTKEKSGSSTYFNSKRIRLYTDSIINKPLIINNIERIRGDLVLEILYNNIDTIYYHYDYPTKRSDDRQPFILNAFFEKSKTQFIGQEYIFTNKGISAGEEKEAIDINTGAEILLKKNDKWKCVDVTLLDAKGRYVSYPYYIPVLIFSNSNGNEVAINYVENKYLDYNYTLPSGEIKPIYSSLFVDFGLNINDFKSLELALIEEKSQAEEQKKIFLKKKKDKEEHKQNILKKYGKYYGNLINNHKVVIGMTIDMCRDSWGTPYEQNETITNNTRIVIWQYNYKTFLQFSNNKLILINK